MRILVIDQENMALDFVLRCTDAGHDVRWYRFSPNKLLRDGEGMPGFKIIDDWRDSMLWARDGLILTTGNFRFLHELDRYREFGYKIFAPTVASARLEIERSVGMDAMKAAGIDLPAYETFDSLEDASRFAWKTDRAWVFKPMGDEGDKSLTYVAHDPADLAGWLDRQIKAGRKLKGRCMLQEKIDLLCEIGVAGWCGPEGFLPDKYEISFEHKKLMDGEIGPATGEQGSICQRVIEDRSVDELLKPIEPIAVALGHRGDFCIGAGIDTKGKIWPFEFTARLGWPAFFLQMASTRGDPAQWMRDSLDGKDTLKVSYDASIGVVCAQPRYPYNNSPPELVEGNPISGVEWPESNVHLVSAMRGRGPVMDGGKVTAGQCLQTTGELVLVATALGKTIERARDKVYCRINEISFPNMMYRQDIGEKVVKALPELNKHGYALDLN